MIGVLARLDLISERALWSFTTIRSGSGFFADFDDVSFRVANLEELRTAPILDWARRGDSNPEMLVGLFSD